MSNDEVKIVKPELSINKKLGNVKFEQVFDTLTVANAEKVVVKNETVFKDETLKDFAALGDLMKQVGSANLSSEEYKRLSALAFSIKSRAQTGGYPLASEVANSMYKFCDKAADVLSQEGYKAIKLHFDALTQVFENKFPKDDMVKSQKLVAGLEAVSKKFTNE